jgi:hypothetical protein
VYLDVESGEKRYAKFPATVKYLEDNVKIDWAATDLVAHDAYRFDWYLAHLLICMELDCSYLIAIWKTTHRTAPLLFVYV